MKSDQKALGILRNFGNQLGVVHGPEDKAKKLHRVTFHHELENRTHEHKLVENQLLRARKLLNAVNGNALFAKARALEANATDNNDIIEAFDLYLKASELRHLDSIFRLGQIFEEGEIVAKSIENLDFALDYFTRIRFQLDHPKHDEAMDYIQSIYLRMGEMYEYGNSTDRDLEKALECYEMVPHRTDDVQGRIIVVSLLFADQILSSDHINLDDLERALELLTKVSVMCPLDTDLKRRIQNLTFDIGRECLSGLKVAQNLQASFKHLEYLYAEDPEFLGLRDLLSKVIKQGILPYGYNLGNYPRAIRVAEYFIQFVFRKKDFQEVVHDDFMQDLILETVTTLLSERPADNEELDERATKLWTFVLESYDNE